MSTGGIKFLQYKQSAPSSTWSVFHGMGAHPLVEVNVYDNLGVLQKAFPLSIVHTDLNNVTITWSQSRTGIVSIASTVV